MRAKKPSSPIAMFMSADIVGATMYKSQHPADAETPGWLDAFEHFFRMTPLRFVGRIAEAFHDGEDIPNTSVWRVRGDEIIFLALPRSATEIGDVTVAFLRTIHDCNELVMRSYGLTVRGCCWAAQLSGRNRAVHIPEMHASYLDYLGPDVDTGFRLTSHADAGEISFSFNLLVALANLPPNPLLRFRHRAMKVLKGIAMHEPYPIVISNSEDALRGGTGVSNPDSVSASELLAAIRSEHPSPSVLEAGAVDFA